MSGRNDLNSRQVQDAFIDRAAVGRTMDRVTRGFFARFGGYTRSVIRRSLRKYSGKASAAGSAPKSRRGFIKRNTFFTIDPTTGSLVVGPAAIGGLRSETLRVLEEGGTVRRKVGRRRRGKNGRFNGPDHRETQSVDIDARPYVDPAWNKAKQMQDTFWSQAAGVA